MSGEFYATNTTEFSYNIIMGDSTLIYFCHDNHPSSIPTYTEANTEEIESSPLVVLTCSLIVLVLCYKLEVGFNLQ